jgi:hypothetical protein
VVRHQPHSLAQAITYTNANNGPGKAAIQPILTACGALRGSLQGLLDRMDANKTLNVATGLWEVAA